MYELKHAIIQRRSKIALAVRFFKFVVVALIAMMILKYLHRQGLPMIPGPRNLLIIYKVSLVLYFLELVRRYYDQLFILGKHRALQISGLFSLRYLKRAITYADIRETMVRQTVMGRIFNYGTLEFGTAASDDYEAVFEEISNPLKVSHLVQDIIAKIRTDPNDNEMHHPND